MSSHLPPNRSRWRRRAPWELLALTALLLSYVWYWEGRFAGAEVLIAVLALAILSTSHWSRRENGRELGFRADNLVKASARVLTWVGPLLLILAITGLAFDLNRELPIPGIGKRLLSMIVFGVLQQYLLLGFLLRRFEEALGRGRLATLATAGLFAALHAPAAWLMAVTFAAGLGACWLYRRTPNLWVLGCAHGLLSVTVAVFLAELLPAGLKVGLRAMA